MKNTLIKLLTLVLVLAPACLETETGSPDDRLPFHRNARGLVNVHVGFSAGEQIGTKSVATPGVENFSEAFLFAFWASGADAGQPCMVDGTPVAIHSDSKSFDWALPAGEPIEVLAVINAVEDVKEIFRRWAYGLAPFSREDFLGLKFTCGSASDLSDLEFRENNMPMTGSVTVTLDPDAPSLTVPVKRLFAKYDITLDVSSWASDGWTVTAARVSGARSNTEVPYFYTGSCPGFKQTDSGKFATVDSSTDSDLEDLNFRGSDNRSKPATYYFLENCQNVEAGASRWSTVALELGSAVDNCSYLKVNVIATKPGYGQRRFGYRIYLDSTEGSALKSGFNIIRNTYRSIVLKLGSPQDGFQWTNTDALNVAQGESVSIPYETTLKADELTFLPLNGGLEYVSHTFQDNTVGLTSFPYGGTAVFRALTSAPDGTYSIKGGNSTWDISDVASVQVSAPVSLTSTIASSHYAFQRFTITLNSENMAGWGEERKNSLEAVFSNLSLRCLSGDTHLIGAGAPYHTGAGGTDILHRQFTVMSTKDATASFQAYNTSSNVDYITIDVPILRPSVKFIETTTGSYSDNGFIGFDSYGDDGPVYDTPITGENVKGYFQLCGDGEEALSIQAEDLALGSLELSGINGFSLSVGAAAGISRTYAITGYIASWSYLDDEGFRSNADDDCSFSSEMYTSNLSLRSESGSLICTAPVHLQVINPFSEWFPGGDFTPHEYTVIVDGTSDIVTSEDFSSDWPYSAGNQPTVLSHGNVNTSKGGYDPYSLVWESHANEVEGIRVADDLHNYGLIEIGGTLTHSRTGNTIKMLWGRVSVIREYVIYAGYQFSQVNYLSSVSTPYDSGNLSRFIPYIFVRDNTGMPLSLRNTVRTTATAATGINAVNPSENFYAETCRAEHWWHGGSNYNSGATDHSGSTLWDCENAPHSRESLLQNKVVVYSSPKTVSSRGELSYYELQYAGPRIETPLPWTLGHNGFHADFVYSFRDVAYWNEPAFEFSSAGINPNYEPEIRTFPSGEKYLALGEYTRYRFFWRMKKHSITKINSYDTRCAIDIAQFFKTTYNAGDGASYQMYYFGETMSRHAYTATAYYDPRRNIREKLKLYTPSIPFYRLQGNVVHTAFDGAVTGSYTEEDIVNSHIMGQAYGDADSFWLPNNQID